MRELARIEVEISEDEILADLLYPAPVRPASPARTSASRSPRRIRPEPLTSDRSPQQLSKKRSSSSTTPRSGSAVAG